MADLDQSTLQMLQQYAATSPNLEIFVNLVKKVTAGIVDNNTVTKLATDLWNKYGKGLKDAAKEIASLGEVLGGTNKIFKDFKEQIEHAASDPDALKKVFNTAGTIAILTTDLLNAKTALAEFEAAAGSANNAANNLYAAIGKEVSAIPILGKVMGEIITKFSQSINSVKGFENAMLGAAMAGGNLYDTIGKGTSDLGDNLTRFTAKTSEDAKMSALGMGTSYQEALSNIKATIEKLPGSFNETFKIIDSTAADAAPTVYKSWDLIGRAAKGTGQTFAEALSTAQSGFQTFGQGSGKAAERIAILSDTSNKLKMPMSATRGLVEGVDQSFKMWGSQLDGTINALEKMSEALGKTGVGFKGQIELTQQLTNGIANMSLPMRSFIALSSGAGGPGGMVGAGLRVEKMLQDNKMGDVINMVQETLRKKTGGQILSLDQATNQPGQEKQFLVQRQLLGTMVGTQDTGTLNRLMEAMSKTALGGDKGKAETEKILSDTLTRGRSVAESQTDIAAQQLSVLRDSASTLKAIQLRLGAKDVLGGTKEEYDNINEERMSYYNNPSNNTLSTFSNENIEDRAAQSMAGATVAVPKGILRTYSALEKTEGVGKYLPSLKTLKENMPGANLAGDVLENVEDYSKGVRSLKQIGSPNVGEMNMPGTRITGQQMQVPRNVAMPETGMATPKQENQSNITFDPIEIKLQIVNQEGKIIAELVDHLQRYITKGSQATY